MVVEFVEPVKLDVCGGSVYGGAGFCEGRGVWWANSSHIIVLLFIKVVRSSS